MLTVQTLLNELFKLVDQGMAQAEVRIGDALEAGPYAHAKVGGIWTSRCGPDEEAPSSVILCASDDDSWKDELDISRGDELPLVWKPPKGKTDGG